MSFETSETAQIGYLGEDIFKVFLKQNNIHILNVNRDNQYDLLDENLITYEIKLDSCAFNTKNLFVEFESYKKYSCLNTTKADIYVFIIVSLYKNDIEIIQFDTPILQQYIKTHDLPVRSAVARTFDDSKTNFRNKGYLLKISDALTICKNHYIITETDKNFEIYIELVKKN